MKTINDFNGVNNVIKDIFNKLDINLQFDENTFDTIMIKSLAATNILGNKKQTHIAITGPNMDVFPFVENLRYFQDPKKNSSFKRHFVIKLPIILMSNNIKYLKDEPLEDNYIIETFTHTARSKRGDGSYQTELSYINMDDEKFINFRKCVKEHDYLIVLKLMNSFKYIFLALKNNENIEELCYFNEKAITSLSAEEINNNDFATDDLRTGKIKEQHNRLIYGAPGTGKSNLLKKDIEKYNIDEEHYERVTFYPDYSYGQFVGMYKPISEGENIKYDFVAGPFLRLLTKALKSKEDGTNEDFVLIVEEINRANAAHVFGDMFQLLDRDENGKSEYTISLSKDMEQFFAKDENPNISKLYLPDNFYIWATMNSGDQGVMPLDSAFKRRFEDYKLVGIDENEDAIKGIRVNINGIGNVEWNDFRKALNSYLIETFNVKEDKLIGPFFIKTKVLKDSVMFDRAFQDKLLMYLAEDILNHNKQRLFGTNSLSKIKENYKSGKVFTENFWTEIIDSDISEIKLHDIEVEQS